MVEKLAKALEGLRNIQFTTSVEDSNISKKKKMLFCVLAADVIVSLKGKNTQNLPAIVENIINLCDDKESDVRMVADESLNRIIMSLSESNILKVQGELHNIIKKNGAARCLRAALTRFGQLSQYIRPNKGMLHGQMLIPALLEVIKRDEESIHETLAASLENIFKVLGVFLQDNTLKKLLKAFLHNLSSSNPVIRRCSASCIITIVQYCRKPLIFNCFVLNSLLDCVVPICEDNSTDLILGVFGCLRLLLPTLICVKNDEGISGSFGVRRRQDESILSVDRLIQAYELCLHYTNSRDHNVVAAALETLNQILQNPPHQLETFFLSPAGFSRSYIHSAKETKLWSRSGSEMSVACSLPPLEDPFLLDDSASSQFSTFSTGESLDLKQLTDRMGQSEDDNEIVESPFKEKVFGKVAAGQTTLDIDSDTDSIATSDAPINFLMRIETEDKNGEDSEFDGSQSNSQENLYSPSEQDAISCSTNPIDVGSFTDTAVPLIYCARHLAASFLLEGTPNSLKGDKSVRVSIKSLALSCISAIIRLYPVIMKMNLAKNQNELYFQEMSDVLLYCDHSDPQIRGGVNILVGQFINSALLESQGFQSDWLSAENSKLNCSELISILVKGLKDKSSVSTRQALSGFKLCMQRGLFSVYNTQFLSLLDYLPALTNNSYWLVKVKLVEILSELPYVCVNDLTKSNVYQSEVIDSVFLPLLGDEDSRVRLATAEALVRIIPVLHHGKAVVQDYAKPFADHLHKWLKVSKNFPSNFSPCPPFSYIFLDPDEVGYDQRVELSLSKIVSKLTYSLLVPKNKYFLYGYLEALKLLSHKYPTTVYSKSWNCYKNEKTDLLPSNLLAGVLSLLTTSPFPLELAAFANATHLLGDLFAGLSVLHLKTNYEASLTPLEEPLKLWDLFKSERIARIAEAMLTHLLKVLNFYYHLVEEVTLSSVAESSAATAFLPLLSPIKKQEKKPGEKTEEKKSKTVNSYEQSTQYARLQQLLKNAYTNYKVSLEASVSEKFLDLLESTLYSLSVLLEVATVQETGRCTQEILTYLLAVVSLRATPVVNCVIQLLRSVFGTNLASHWEERKLASVHFHGFNLFDMLFHLPTELLAEKIRRRVNSNFVECENLRAFNKKGDRKIILKDSDKNWLATYIRMIEPMVIKSLQLYTIRGNVELQANVLRLLNQLVQLRVNYNLLDEKQVFLDFVLKQFELIEHGQIPRIDILLPQIFKFLVLLSSKHLKVVISIPKTLQLCDGLMASDQPVQTHCIPALIPVVENVFLSRSLVSSVEEKELETQREVLLSMLLRLAEFPQVIDLLTLILNESKTMEEKEKWKRWSRQVMETVLPLVGQDRLHIETLEGQNSFAKLMASLSPSVLRPIDPLLKALFVEPGDYNCPISLKRWLAKVTVLLETVLFVKEDALLSRLGEICPNINLATFLPTGNLGFSDPFNVQSFFRTYEPAEAAARFILKVIASVGSKILDCLQLQQKFSTFFVCVFHILKSGAFHRITNALQELLSKEQESMGRICSLFHKMMHVCPMLTCQFSYFLALLNYCDESYWSQVLRKPSTLSAKLVQTSAVIALSDYLCDNLSDTTTLHYLLQNSVEELVAYSHEIPIKELLAMIQRRKSDWSLFLEMVSSRSFHSSRPHFVERLLRLLEVTESCHSGVLLTLIVNKFLASPRLALALLAGSIACRQVEYLLTLPREKVLEQIDQEAFKGLIAFFREEKYLKRHSTLWGLLEKLGIQVFDFSLTDLKSSQGVESGQLKDVNLDEAWFSDRVKQRCCQKGFIGEDVSFLLSKLSYERVLEIMSSSAFNLRVLKDCLLYPETLSKKHQLQEYEANEKEVDAVKELLFKVSERCLLQKLKEMRILLEEVRGRLQAEDISSWVLEKLSPVRERLGEMTSCLTIYLRLVFSNEVDIEKEYLEDVCIFGLLCLEVIAWDTRREKKMGESGQIYPRNLEGSLRCCSAVLNSRSVAGFLSQATHRQELRRCVENVFSIVCHLVPFCLLNKALGEESVVGTNEAAQLEFLLKFIMETDELLPKYLMDCFRDVVLSLCRIPVLSSHVLKVPDSGDMQEIELLKDFISRFSVIGWSSRQQFEEIWVALLSVLGFNTQGDVPLEETGFIVQASTTAVDGITTLLKNTLLDCGSKKLIHHGRDSLSMKDNFEKLPLIQCSVHENDPFSDRTYHFLDNLELLSRDERYVHGLLSVEYLWTAVKQRRNRVDLYEKHSRQLRTMGLDLPSCIHLLTELYNQWIHQASPDIRIITASLKSAIVISDLFTDLSQFQWLLNFCLRTDEVIIAEDTVVLPLIILGCCKAGVIAVPDEEVCEKIKKLLLRCKNLPCKIAAAKGLLYLLQSKNVVPSPVSPPESFSHTEEADFLGNAFNIFLPVALEIIQEFKLKSTLTNEATMKEYERCHWSLVFYLLQHCSHSLKEHEEEFLSFILTTLCSRNCCSSTMSLLIRGTERLLLTTIYDKNFKEQLTKVALEIISNNSIIISRNGLQLLTFLSFLDKRAKNVRQLVMGQDDPEKVMKDMEKINILFETLKRSYPKEAEVVGSVTSYILMDFTASDVLTKVIQEFLSSQQPHQKILAGLLFKAFKRAEQSLLEDWVVFSLPSFIQGLPIAMSIWTLNCFFVSASSEPWLRFVFPLVQSRIRMAGSEDKKLLCLSASHFYKQLKQEAQKKSFIETFKKAAAIDSVFFDLLSALQ